MRLPSAGSSPETLKDTYGVYHLTRMRADKAMKDLADAFEAAQQRLEVRMTAYKAAFFASQTAMAVRDGDDAAFDDAVRAFAAAILGKVGNRRTAPLYVKYFPAGLNDVVSVPLETELQKAGIILAKLAEEEDETLKTHAGTLTAIMNTLSAAMDAHRAALDAEVQAYGLLANEKVNWMDAYKRSYRDLGRIFYQVPQKADTYFKPAPKGKKGDETPGELPAPPAAK